MGRDEGKFGRRAFLRWISALPVGIVGCGSAVATSGGATTLADASTPWDAGIGAEAGARSRPGRWRRRVTNA